MGSCREYGHVVEWYRVDESRKILRFLAEGAMLLTSGALVFAWSLTEPDYLAPEVCLLVSVVGVAITASGPLRALIRLSKVMNLEAYLVLHAHGVMDQSQGRERFIPWDDIAEVGILKGRSGFQIETRGGETFEISKRFAGVSHEKLVRRLRDAQRKGVWNLLDSLPPQPGISRRGSD